MIKCLIVDDEPVARGIVRNYCNHLAVLEVVAECGNAFEAKEILDANHIDLLFLDINMPVLNGIGFLNTLKKAPQVIFTTAYQEHAVTAFDLAACDYLLKPFSLERFIVAIDKAKDVLNKQVRSLEEPGQQISKDSFLIRADAKIYHIRYTDCIYAEAQGNYSKVVTTQKQILTKMTFSDLAELLPVEIFIRVHRSFLINKTMIEHIESNRVFVRGAEIPVAGTYKAMLLKILGME